MELQPRSARGRLAKRVYEGVLELGQRNAGYADKLRRRAGISGSGTLNGAEVSRLKRIMDKHPLLGLVGASIAIEGSFQGAEIVSDLFSSVDAAEIAAEWSGNEAYQEVVEKLIASREAALDKGGDGSADTVSGLPVATYQQSALLLKEAHDRIRRLSSFFGGVDRLEQVWRDLAALEPEHFESYRVFVR